jgi:hypothetical protein
LDMRTVFDDDIDILASELCSLWKKKGCNHE